MSLADHRPPGFMVVRIKAHRRLIAASVTMLLLLVAWQVYGTYAPNILELPTPVNTVQAFLAMSASGDLWVATRESGAVFVVGSVPAILLGVLMGLIIGSSRSLDIAFSPYIFAFYATPFPALIPLFVLMFGIGFVGKVAIVFTLVWIAVLLQTIAGVKSVDTRFLEVAQAFGSSGLRTTFEVRFPAALSFVVAGIRLAVGRALVGVVIAEFDTALAGLGYLIFRNSQRLELPEALVPGLLLAFTGIILTTILRRYEVRLERWKQAS